MYTLLRTTLATLACISLAGCIDDPLTSDRAGIRFYEGERGKPMTTVTDPEIALLDIQIRGREFEATLRSQTRLIDGAAQIPLAIPYGKGYQLQVRGYNRYGEQTYEGKSALAYVELGEANEPLAVDLFPLGEGKPATAQFAVIGEDRAPEGLQLVIEPGWKKIGEGRSMILRAYALDPKGERIDLDPNELHWSVDDPRNGRFELDPARRDDGTYFLPFSSEKYEILLRYRDLIREEWLDGEWMLDVGFNSWLFAANSPTSPGQNGVIQILRINPGQLQATIHSHVSVASGVADALHVLDTTLYAVTGAGTVELYSIDAINGGLTLRSSVSAGGPPHRVAASRSNFYVANRGSGNVSVFSIDASQNLTALQTATVAAIGAIQIDTVRRLLFTGSRASGATGPQVCAHALQTNGSLPASPASCVNLSGAPESMLFAGGVLFTLHNGPVPAPGFGNTNFVTAWTVSATGNLTQRGQPLDVGAATAAGMTTSSDGAFLFLPRQGSFQTISTADPLQAWSTTPAYSPACVWPPASPGSGAAHPGGTVLYVSDPIGAAVGNMPGGRVSTLGIGAGGVLTPILCESVGGKPNVMALFTP